ncbi:hypothetical protein Ddye_025643 [Dipteronia dyeriana]|uniref:Bidirectional sugar transporter SWEET n=1 Tax=Dipteronia dyeriana TaxID=168575 RepID=A0AAD9WPQ1_9ROSI|nr:hypothetical protein Ddye_025643 [Dipteronia dyeriana]
MPTLSFCIGIIGNVVSMLLLASPIRTFWKVVKKKSTGDFKGVPYITSLLSSSLWTLYGLLKPGGFLIMTVNGGGTIMQVIYITIFLIYAPREKKIKTATLAVIFDVGFLGTVFAITLLAMHKLSLRLTFLGIICAGLSIVVYASPLLVMRIVVKTKSVEYMPFSLSFFLFLNAGVWSFYSVLIKDIYMGVPNAIGFVLGSAQVILYVIYKNKSRSNRSMDVMEEDGSVHLVKQSIIEMRAYDQDGDFDDGGDKVMINDPILNRGTSLPKSSINRQYNSLKLIRTVSLGPYDVFPNWSDDAISNVKRNFYADHP